MLLVGLAYKRNTGDARQSPAIGVARRLAELGARLQAVDPLVDVGARAGGGRAGRVHAEVVAAADLVIVLTDHDAIAGTSSNSTPTGSSTPGTGCAGTGVDRL